MMEDTPVNPTDQTASLPDEDGVVMIYGFLVIRDTETGEVIVNTRA